MTLSEKILRFVIIIGIFLLPFVPTLVSSSLFFPFITGKNFAFRALVEIITACWLALVLINAHYRPRRSWILWAFAVFVIIIAIADAQGVNPFKSFWSNYERMDGWVTIAHLLCYTVVASCVLNAEKIWRRLFMTSLGVSVFLGLYGFLQIAGALALGEGGSGGLGARIDATFGNPIYLAVYMLFHVFIAAMLIVQQGKERWGILERIVFPVGLLVGLVYILASGSTLSASLILLYFGFIAVMAGVMFLPQVYLLSFAIVLDAAALLFTATRGTILGLIGGGVLTVLIYILFAYDAKRVRPYAIGGLVALFVLCGGVYLTRDSTAVKNISFLNRLSSISLSDPTINSRFINAQMAWQGIKERPILGWGQENYAIVFDKYYDPRMYSQEQWFDRVHDIIFDWWVAGGTLGLLAYLSIFGALFYVLWRSSAFRVAEKSILAGLMVGYFIHNITVFDNITSYILFGTILAYVVFREGEADNLPRLFIPQMWREAAPAVALAGAILALGSMWFINGTAFEQNRSLLSALSQQGGGVAQNLALFQQTIAYGTYGTQEAREQLVQIATEISTASASQVPNDLKSQVLSEAATQMQMQAVASPLDARFPLFLGSLLDSYGQYATAATALEKAHELSPGKQTIIFEQALNAEAQGDSAGAVKYFGEAYNLDTADLQARLYYAAAAIAAGDDATADTLLAPITKGGQAADSRIASAYGLRKEYSKIIPIWQAAIVADPTNVQAYFTLGAAYYALGNQVQAIKVLQADAQANPSSASQVQQVIQQIQSGKVKVQ